MRLTVMGAMTVLTATAALAQPVPAPITGNWRTDDNSALINVAPCTPGGTALCGRIVRFLVAEPAGGFRDRNNPNRALRSRELIGVTVLQSLQWREGAWRGQGYSPQDGRNFNAILRPEGNRLSVRGCVAVFCRTVEWTRAR
jgi:uncharacterized protein (DUF2147 family)